MYNLDSSKFLHSPRALRFWECCIATFFENLSNFEAEDLKREKSNQFTIDKIVDTSNYLTKSFRYYFDANKNHMSRFDYENSDWNKESLFKQSTLKDNLLIQQFTIDGSLKISKPRIAVANTKVLEENIIKSLRKTPNLNGARFDALSNIFKRSTEENVNILLFPECFIPIDLLSAIVKFSVNEQILVVTGVEHITIDGVSFNFIITILPFEKNGVKDAVVVYRLKNHYSHAEKLMIETNHFKSAKAGVSTYDLYIWRGIYFSSYYCFELADVFHRGIFKSQIDLLIACECNSDTNYFSNIVESISRDLHVYVAQVNTSQFGDTRITQPTKTETKDILKLKGGENDTILVGDIDIDALREFQRELYISTKENKRGFKPLPPDFSLEEVMKRISYKSII